MSRELVFPHCCGPSLTRSISGLGDGTLPRSFKFYLSLPLSLPWMYLIKCCSCPPSLSLPLCLSLPCVYPVYLIQSSAVVSDSLSLSPPAYFFYSAVVSPLSLFHCLPLPFYSAVVSPLSLFHCLPLPFYSAAEGCKCSL